MRNRARLRLLGIRRDTVDDPVLVDLALDTPGFESRHITASISVEQIRAWLAKAGIVTTDLLDLGDIAPVRARGWYRPAFGRDRLEDGEIGPNPARDATEAVETVESTPGDSARQDAPILERNAE